MSCILVNGLGWVGSGLPASVVGWVGLKNDGLSWTGLQKMDPCRCLRLHSYTPNSVASLMPDHKVIGCGGWKRLSPVGGWAYGTPRNVNTSRQTGRSLTACLAASLSCSFTVLPRSIHDDVRPTTGSAICRQKDQSYSEQPSSGVKPVLGQFEINNYTSN